MGQLQVVAQWRTFTTTEAVSNCRTGASAGGEGASVWQPRYLRDGSLVYVMDRSEDDPSAGYWQIYHQSGDDAATRLTHGQLEFGEPFGCAGECRLAELASGGLWRWAPMEKARRWFRCHWMAPVRPSPW